MSYLTGYLTTLAPLALLGLAVGAGLALARVAVRGRRRKHAPAPAAEGAPPPRRRLRTAAVCLGVLGVSLGTLGADQLQLACRGERWLLSDYLPAQPQDVSSGLALGSARREADTAAPDALLPDVATGRDVHLSDYWDHEPVVLVFGSFGCDIFRGQLDALKQLQTSYGDRVQFLFVYVREAPHAAPEMAGAPGGVCVMPPLDATDQRERIRYGLKAFDLPFVCLDSTGHPDVERAYSAWPAHLVVVGKGGRIALDAGTNLPAGWDLAAVDASLHHVL